MGSGRRLVHDQNISHRGRGIGGGSAAAPATAESSTPAKLAVSGAASATAAERNSRHLVKVADRLDAVIGKCAFDPELETVHRLRTGSRRVQATVETILRQAGAAGKSFAKPAKLWLRSIRNIRRAAGPVRDLDVHRQMLGEIIARWAIKTPSALPSALQIDPVMPHGTREQDNAAKALDAAPDSPKDVERLTSQANRLDDWLQDNRRAGAETLRTKIKKTREKLEQRRAAFQSALESAPALLLKPRRSPGLVALEDFVRVVDRMPLLDSGNLHDFRKLTKKARYVAESGEEPSSQTIAKALKRVQDAIGNWHDWQCLAAEAKAALEKDGHELTAWLEGQAEYFLAVALSISERVRGQLLGEWMAAQSERRAGKTASRLRKPPARTSQTRGVKGSRPTSGAA